MKNVKSFNELNENKNLKKFALTTKSESSDDYIYFIEHPEKPTQEELETFLIDQGGDVYDGHSYENVVLCVEIKNFKRI